MDFEVKEEIKQNANVKEINVEQQPSKVIDVEPISTTASGQTVLEGPGF